MLIPLPAGDEPLVNDKVMHGLIFFMLAFLMHRAYPKFKFIRTLAPILVIYGFMIEVLQNLTGYRNFSMLDFAADILGVALYCFALGLMYKLAQFQTTKA